MRILLDHCVDINLSTLIAGHDVHHASSMGWERLSNGKLLDAAERDGFLAVVTVDKNVRFQQNIAKRRISLITLNPVLVDYRYLEPMVPKLLFVLQQNPQPGSEIVVEP